MRVFFLLFLFLFSSLLAKESKMDSISQMFLNADTLKLKDGESIEARELLKKFCRNEKLNYYFEFKNKSNEINSCSSLVLTSVIEGEISLILFRRNLEKIGVVFSLEKEDSRIVLKVTNLGEEVIVTRDGGKLSFERKKGKGVSP